ncbi:MAG: glycosyltransferase family 4 protein [Muribaculaceae bacterium]|nr:glycosyltransferase family 4 protein [Muribaculaceae bacterium]
MKIIQIIPGKIWGGAEQYIVDIGRGLTARGHEVTYVAHNRPAVTDQLRREGIDFITMPLKWSLDSTSARMLAEMLNGVDVIHVHNPMFVPIAIRACSMAGSNARIVMTRHDSHRTPVNIFLRRMWRRLDNVICVSDFVRRAWHGANRWYPADRCVVLHNSIPATTPQPVESLRAKYGISPDTPLLVFSGRVKKSKGCGVLIEALSHLAHKQWALVMIGACKPADYEATLTASAAKAGIADRIHFYGFTKNARDLMRQADIGVAPAVAKDSFPLTNLEFMLSGVCLVSSTSGGQPECIDDGHTGFLVKPGDVTSLVQVLEKLLDNPALRLQVAKAGQEYFIHNMDFDSFLDRLLSIYAH